MNLENFLLENEPIVRMSFFFGMLMLIGAWELYAPKKAPTISKAYRWVNNLGLVFLNSFIVKLLIPMASTGVALLAIQNNWGILNYYEVPHLLGIIIFIVVMDLIIYFQHIMVHAVPILWRLHRVHHADLDYDTTTGSRFHPIEIILSMMIKFTAIVLIGPSVVAVILFEIILNAMAMFNHANASLPKPLDKVLRYLIVTPDMHRVHHSIEQYETNSNFGFNISIWDRIFGTYKEDADAGQDNMVIGIQDLTDKSKTNNIFGMLLIPFIKRNDKYIINSKNKYKKD